MFEVIVVKFSQEELLLDVLDWVNNTYNDKVIKHKGLGITTIEFSNKQDLDLFALTWTNLRYIVAFDNTLVYTNL